MSFNCVPSVFSSRQVWGISGQLQNLQIVFNEKSFAVWGGAPLVPGSIHLRTKLPHEVNSGIISQYVDLLVVPFPSTTEIRTLVRKSTPNHNFDGKFWHLFDWFGEFWELQTCRVLLCS